MVCSNFEFGKKAIGRAIFTVLLTAVILLFPGSLNRLSADQLTPEELVRKAIENFQNLQSCQYRIILHLTKGGAVQDSEYIFYYQKPNLFRMYVKKGRDQGSTVLLREDGCIRGRGRGLLSVVAITLKPDDKRLCDLWGRKFYEADWGTILQETEARITEGMSSRVEGVEGGKQILLTVQGKDGSFEKTWLGADQLTLFKKQARKECGDTLDVTWTDVVLNPEFKEGFFDF
jgi:outer membrane lipoprotein-sorting protein